MRSLGYHLLASVCVGPPILFGALAAPAFAQDQVHHSAPGDTAGAASDAAAPDIDASEGGDIVVTATLRRSDTRRLVKACVSPCRSRGLRDTEQNKNDRTHQPDNTTPV